MVHGVANQHRMLSPALGVSVTVENHIEFVTVTVTVAVAVALAVLLSNVMHSCNKIPPPDTYIGSCVVAKGRAMALLSVASYLRYTGLLKSWSTYTALRSARGRTLAGPRTSGAELPTVAG